MTLIQVPEAPDAAAEPRRRSLRALTMIIILGCFATLAATVYIGREPGMYYSRASVLFLAPISAHYPNRFISGGESLIATAGVVRDLVSTDSRNVAVVSDSVTLPSLGITHGYSVVLPNSGGQWATNFDKPQLDIQAVGTTAEEVTSTMNDLIARINSSLAALQDEAGTDAVDRITTRTDPPAIPLYYTQGSRVRAAAATLLLGVGATVVAATVLPSWLARLRRR